MPDLTNITTALSTGNVSVLDLCNNPTATFDCSQDPNFGNLADSCYTVSAGLTYNISFLNLHGEIKYYVEDCAVKSMCPQLKKTACDNLNDTFAGMSAIGFSHCDVSCCQRDLCNNPSGSPTTSPSGSPATGPPGSPATSPPGSPTTSPPTSSVKSTHIPPTVAIFKILGLFTVAFMSSF